MFSIFSNFKSIVYLLQISSSLGIEYLKDEDYDVFTSTLAYQEFRSLIAEIRDWR